MTFSQKAKRSNFHPCPDTEVHRRIWLGLGEGPCDGIVFVEFLSHVAVREVGIRPAGRELQNYEQNFQFNCSTMNCCPMQLFVTEAEANAQKLPTCKVPVRSSVTLLYCVMAAVMLP